MESILSVCYERTGRLVALREGAFYLFREEDALAPAREVCPAAPVEIIRPPTRA